MPQSTAILLQSPYSVQTRPGGVANAEYRDAEAFEAERKYSFFGHLFTVVHHLLGCSKICTPVSLAKRHYIDCL
jgi:hypothetical protein